MDDFLLEDEPGIKYSPVRLSGLNRLAIPRPRPSYRVLADKWQHEASKEFRRQLLRHSPDATECALGRSWNLPARIRRRRVNASKEKEPNPIDEPPLK